MKTTIKLTLYYFVYQFACLFVLYFFFYAYYSLAGYLQTGTLQMAELTAAQNFDISVLSMLVSSAIYGWHIFHFRYVQFNRPTFSPVSTPLMLSIIPLTFGMIFWMNYVVEALSLPNVFEDLFVQMMNSPLGILSIAIVAPIFEEILFRGAIQGHLLRSGVRPQYAILLSALVFGIIHGNPAQIPFAFVLGLLLGWLYYITGSLLPGILLHFINNTTSVILMLTVPESASSMNQMFGPTNAAALALFGLILTVCFIYIIQRLMANHS